MFSPSSSFLIVALSLFILEKMTVRETLASKSPRSWASSWLVKKIAFCLYIHYQIQFLKHGLTYWMTSFWLCVIFNSWNSTDLLPELSNIDVYMKVTLFVRDVVFFLFGLYLPQPSFLYCWITVSLPNKRKKNMTS